MSDEIIIDGYPVNNYRLSSGRFPSGGHKALIPILMKKFGVCYWCGIQLIHYKRDESKIGKKDPPNAATIDHLITRWERKPNEIVPKVLCCYKCNGERAKKDEKKFLKSRPKVIHTP